MKKKNILIIVSHTDDETIGMGGTIKKHVNEGHDVFAISMTDGVKSRGNVGEDEIKKRKLASEKVSKELGFKWVENYSFLDNEMDKHSLLEIIKCIEKVKDMIKPSLVYTHSGADLSIDHQIVTKAVLTAFRPQPNELCREIRLFEVASATDFGYKNVTGKFEPNLFIEISENWESKLSALKKYGSELLDYPHSRSLEAIKNLATLRGNRIGYNMAEAFEVIRKIET